MTSKQAAIEYVDYWEEMDPERAAIIKAGLSRIAELEAALEDALTMPYWGDNQDDHDRLYKVLEGGK
jgi:hypothetical protein